ncbi:hypothetical protein BDV38DRAFT_279536 [Aspergillus pseudotamarii]|uniref:AB hydrolase-1 domain-containing protein n=1 Tax=Aspergillus pseudotamarii TaxID=132259 RepID=A0A5N6T463_ASPPS|nr:uncharacterized protein BDV38DRAFT_279536 [Aspergillus pseudotamarii]KAE8141087.1 hypothetical protein BDV38DRAFT_279536 [Aspergillus pseudotamarii]
MAGGNASRKIERKGIHDTDRNLSFGFTRLPQLRPSVLYIFGERSKISTPPLRREMLEMTGSGVRGSGGTHRERVKEVVLPTGHLVPMENALECARVSASLSHSEVSRWETDQQ